MRFTRAFIGPAYLFIWICQAGGQNLITNGDFELGNIAFTNDYKLQTGTGVGAGTYAVNNNPHNVFAGWGSYTDHTSGSGNMLILDGSATPDSVLWRQTVPVVTNTFYVFSAWTLRFDTDVPPPAVLYFAINGVQQGPFHTLPSTPGGWYAYGATWLSASANTAVLELKDHNGQLGPSNNLALDDVSFVEASVLPLPVLSVTSSNTVVVLTWFAYPGASYQLQTTDTLITNSWTNLGSAITGAGTTASITDPISTQRFYRVLTIN